MGETRGEETIADRESAGFVRWNLSPQWDGSRCLKNMFWTNDRSSVRQIAAPILLREHGSSVRPDKDVDTMLFPSEEELRESFLKHATPALWSRPAPGWRFRTALESTCSEGRADWVWAGIADNWPEGIEPEAAELLQQPTCSRILDVLKPQSVRRESLLHARSGVAATTFRRWLIALVETRLVDDLGDGRYVLGPQFAWPQIEICSFEFKLGNWKRAFYQAKRYRSFSHRVFVVMPTKTVERVNGALEHFRRFNVGLIAHDPDGSSRRILPSVKREPISRTCFIRALGMLLGQEEVSPAIR